MKKIFIRILFIFAAFLIFSCQRQSAIPRPDHVIVVVEENHNYEQIIGSPDAPFINQLARESAVFTNAHGVIHPSQPNYLALYSGSLQGVMGDKCLKDSTPFSTPNLGAGLISKGFSFKGFAETMPEPGFLGCRQDTSASTMGFLYARKHAPWVNWQGKGKNDIPDSASQPMTAFPGDFNQLPDVSFVIPNMDNDMHNIGEPGDSAAIRRGDDWLKAKLQPYIEWAKDHNSLLILTFDEDQFTVKNHMLTLITGAGVIPGKYGERVDHYSLLHTIEGMYDIPVSDSNREAPITYIWKKKG
ncbi:MAG TPA: alkaline phosphatase family protein [Puia sp.]